MTESNDQQPKRPCAQCPWRISNHGKKHRFGFYQKKNLTRLWNQIRRGDGVQSCHLTDPSHPDHVAVGAKPEATPQECPGSVILIWREIEQLKNRYGEDPNRYLRGRRRGLTRNGLTYWVIERITLGGTPFIGGPRLPPVTNDPEIDLPDYLKDEVPLERQTGEDRCAK